MPWGPKPAPPNTDFRKNKINTVVEPGPPWFSQKNIQKPKIQNKPLLFNWVNLKDLPAVPVNFPPVRAWTSELFKK